jgi:pimeloyl-ACP methyl ester carboxylesterase
LPPTKLKAVAVVVGLGPPDIGMSGARIINRIGFPYGFRYCPSFLNRWFWQQDAIGRIDLSDEERLNMVLLQIEKSRAKMPEKDLAIAGNLDYYRQILKSTREAFAQGYDGVLLDAKLCCFDFGFKVEDIRLDLPVQLWYGKQDVFVPPNHGVQLAKRLGSRAHLRLEDETHQSLMVNYKKEILESLIKFM